jgi:hypothetical protein
MKALQRELIAHSPSQAKRLVGHAVLVFAEVPVWPPRQEQDGEDGHESDGTISDCSHGPRPREAGVRNRAVNLKCSTTRRAATVMSVDQNSIQ